MIQAPFEDSGQNILLYTHRFIRAWGGNQIVWDEYAEIDGALPSYRPRVGWRSEGFGLVLYGSQFDDVLDLGCGSARWRPFFAKARYVGIDANRKAIAAAGRRYGSVEDTKIVAGHAAQIPCAAESFDVVFTCGVLQTVSDVTLMRVACDVKRVLRRGGRYIGIEGTKGSWPAQYPEPLFLRDQMEWRGVLGFGGLRYEYQSDGLHVFRAL